MRGRSKWRHNLISFFQFFKEFFERFKYWKIPKCVELTTQPNAIKHKFKRVDLRNVTLKYDVIHAALEVICNKHLKRPRKFDDIGSFGDMGTGMILAKNSEIA